MIYENFYIKAPKELLEVPLPLSMFKKEDDSYMNIVEYLATIGHTVDRFSTDGYFIKGFGFNYDGLRELENKAGEFGLEIGINMWILSPVEVHEELSKPEWNPVVETPIYVASEQEVVAEHIVISEPEATVESDVVPEPVIEEEFATEILVENPQETIVQEVVAEVTNEG